MNDFSQFAIEFTTVATVLMIILISLFLAIVIMLITMNKSIRNRDKKIIQNIKETNEIFKSIKDAENNRHSGISRKADKK